MTPSHALPQGITVLERGWLSSNSVLLVGRDETAVVDTGYASHAAQTVTLLTRALDDRPLGRIVNTHLHSDHCGGNAALQSAFPHVHTSIPPGLSEAVSRWDEVALTYQPTGQNCERFVFDSVLQPGMAVVLGGRSWEVHAAAGHDPHSIILFEPSTRTLLSADALWEHGFGVVFPELEGDSGFEEVGATLDLIESLKPRQIVPGHGAVFWEDQLGAALARARSRLDAFIHDPARHARHAAKVLLKFKLLELQRVEAACLRSWALQTPYFQLLFATYFKEQAPEACVQALMLDLVRAGAACMDGDSIVNI